MVINQSLNYVQQIDSFFGREKNVGKMGMKKDATITISFIANDEVALQSTVNTNNLGFISDKKYQIDRPVYERQFRIYFAGDSMTGSTTMDFQWVDLVQDLLNSNAALKEAVGVDVFKVYNGGVPGAGFKHFWEKYESVGAEFDPNLVVVNYIESDFPRVGKSGHEAHTDDETIMVDNAALHTNSLEKALGDNVIFTIMPLYQDLYPELSSFRLSKLLIERSKRKNFFFMHNRLDWENNQSQVRTWYNLPHDGHMSEIGGLKYALATASLVAERLTGKSWKFSTPKNFELAGALPISKEFFTPKNFKENLFGPLSDIWDPSIVITGNDTKEIHSSWIVRVDGRNGTGQVMASLFNINNVQTVRLSQIKPSTNGSSSLTVITPAITDYDERNFLTGFAYKIPDPNKSTKAHVYFYLDYETEKNGRKSQLLHHDFLKPVNSWQSNLFNVSIPSSIASQLDRREANFRIQFLAVTGNELHIDLKNLLLVPNGAADEINKKTVTIGDRLVDVSAFVKLRREIDAAFLGARERSWELYGVKKLLKKTVPYGFLPAGVPYTSGFAKLKLDKESPETVLLNIYCTAGELSLENTDCYHSYQVYMK